MRRYKQLVQPRLPKQAFAVAVGGGRQVSTGRLQRGVDPLPPPAGFTLSVATVDNLYGFTGGEGGISPTSYLGGTIIEMAVVSTTNECYMIFDPPDGAPLTGPGGTVTELVWTYAGQSVSMTWSGTDYVGIDAGMTTAVVTAAGTDIDINLSVGSRTFVNAAVGTLTVGEDPSLGQFGFRLDVMGAVSPTTVEGFTFRAIRTNASTDNMAIAFVQDPQLEPNVTGVTLQLGTEFTSLVWTGTFYGATDLDFIDYVASQVGNTIAFGLTEP